VYPLPTARWCLSLTSVPRFRILSLGGALTGPHTSLFLGFPCFRAVAIRPVLIVLSSLFFGPQDTSPRFCRMFARAFPPIFLKNLPAHFQVAGQPSPVAYILNPPPPETKFIFPFVALVGLFLGSWENILLPPPTFLADMFPAPSKYLAKEPTF